MRQDQIQEIFTSNIRHLRRKSKLSQEQLADKLLVSRPAIGSYEEGRAMPAISVLLKMCDLFDIRLEALVTIEIPYEPLTEDI